MVVNFPEKCHLYAYFVTLNMNNITIYSCSFQEICPLYELTLFLHAMPNRQPVYIYILYKSFAV